MSIGDLWYKNAIIYCLKVNVADQRRDPQSLLNWTERMIRARKECPEISWGNFVVLRTNVPEVLAMRYDWRKTSLVTLHNFSTSKQKVEAKIGCARDGLLVEVFDGRHSKAGSDGAHHFELDGYAWRWFRVGGPGQRARPIRPGSHEPDALT